MFKQTVVAVLLAVGLTMPVLAGPREASPGFQNVIWGDSVQTVLARLRQKYAYQNLLVVLRL